MAGILRALIAAGEVKYAANLADRAGQNRDQVYIALAEDSLRANRLREARREAVQAWRDARQYGGQKEAAIPKLLFESGDLRGARFIADEYRNARWDYNTLITQMKMYEEVLEATPHP